MQLINLCGIHLIFFSFFLIIHFSLQQNVVKNEKNSLTFSKCDHKTTTNIINRFRCTFRKKAFIYDLWIPLHDNTFPITQLNRNVEFNINLGHKYVHYISLHYLKKWKNYSDPSMLFYVSSSSSQMPALILHPSCHLIFLCSSLPFSF